MALVQFNAMTPVPAVRWRQFSSEGCYLPHQPPSGPAGRRQEPTLRSGTPRLAAVDPKQPECYHQHRDPHDVERPGIEKSNRTTAHPVTQRPDLAQRPDQSRCQATVKTDPPWSKGRSQQMTGCKGCRPVGEEATGTDGEIRRGGGDAAPAGARLGAETHREGVRVQQEHSETLRRGRRLDGVQPTGGRRQARGSGGVAEGALLPAPRQCRGGAPGPGPGSRGST